MRDEILGAEMWMVEPDTLERDVAGQYNTFRVYVHMMKVKEASARNVCNALEMSSPSLALLHLNKLVSLGLLTKKYGNYYLESTRRVGILRFFYQFGTWFIPRTFLYFLFFASMGTVFFYLAQKDQGYVIPTIVIAMSALLNLYEAIQLYRVLSYRGVHKVD